mmetsp:Transcript_23717/g.74624  ORF Transcript_23717/g.74624 Transcript_23717/m.74624 type:complete len:355 (-) Transcript_23717:901-1965(-)
MRRALALSGLVGTVVSVAGLAPRRGPAAARSSALRRHMSATTEGSASLARPPASFSECISQAQKSVDKVLEDGGKLVEVDFPPLPAALMEDVSSSADDLMQANINLGVDFAQRYALQDIKVAMIYPDEFEAKRAAEILGGTDNPAPGLTIHSIRRAAQSTAGSFDQLFAGLFGKRAGEFSPPEGADMFVCLGFSAQELPDLELLHEAYPDTPLIGFNTKLDAARGDLGLPAFPPRDLHNRFLSKFRPAYLLRTRSYALSLPRPPFVLAYQGALFRCYPEPYQTLLDVGDGRYKAVEVAPARPALGVFKDQLTENLKLQDGEGADSTLAKLRKGVVNKTWWERLGDDEEDTAWRT